MIKDIERVMFCLGDTLKVYLIETTLTGVLVREDRLGITLQDISDETIYRFILWEELRLLNILKKLMVLMGVIMISKSKFELHKERCYCDIRQRFLAYKIARRNNTWRLKNDGIVL